MKLTERTLIPISLVSFIGAGVVWVTQLAANVEHNKHEIQRIILEQRERVLILRSIDNRLSRIEGTLGVKDEKNR